MNSMMLFFKSIKFRLTLWYLVVIVLLLALFGTGAYFILSFQLRQNLDESLRTTSQELESTLGYEQGQVTLPTQVTGIVMVYSADGTLMAKLGPDIRSSEVNNMVRLALLGGSYLQTGTTQDGQQIRFFATPFTVAPNTRVAIVVGKPPTDIQSVLGTLKSILGLSALIAVVLAAVGGSILASRAFHPFLRIIGAADDIGRGNLSRRVDIHSEDEIGTLASSLNHMIDRLETSFKKEKQFAADASHELRTPLAVIVAESTLALEKEREPEEYRKSLRIVVKEAGYMTAMLTNLLLMVRTEAGKEPFNFERVNITDLLIDLAVEMAVLAREKGLRFQLDPVDDLFVEGDRLKLRQLFLNILENALRYTRKGGRITCSATARDGNAVVSVTDTGIGIAAEQIPLIFERFYRIDKARSRADGGAGLGLAIAKFIAEAHGGKIEVDSVEGKGSTFRILVPLFRANGASQSANTSA